MTDYQQAFVQGITLSRRGLGVRMCFSTFRAGVKIDWDVSNRLKAGSLIALSPVSDKFKKNIVIAVIAARPKRFVKESKCICHGSIALTNLISQAHPRSTSSFLAPRKPSSIPPKSMSFSKRRLPSLRPRDTTCWHSKRCQESLLPCRTMSSRQSEKPPHPST
jgi:hypothetical protein